MRRTDHQLVQSVLDGSVTREEFDAFQQRLRAEPELAVLYKEYALLDHTLHEEFDGKPAGEMVAGEDAGTPRPTVLILILLIVCATAVILFFTKPWDRTPQTENIALVTFSLDAVWQVDGFNRKVGSATGVSAGAIIHLSQGRTGIHLGPSIVAHLEGPAEATLVARDTLYLSSGAMFLDSGETQETVTISTPQCALTSQGAHYGILADSEGTTEVHVVRGTVEIKTNGNRTNLAAGNAVRIHKNASAYSIPLDVRTFPKTLGRYRYVPIEVFDRKGWRVEYGNPKFSEDRIEGSNYAIYQAIPDVDANAAARGVLLLTINVGKPTSGEFHTDGWAGVSLYQNRQEILFFGDPYGLAEGWALDVKNQTAAILSKPLVSGPKSVTLRYQSRTGDVTLHEGGFPLKPPFCKSRIQPGIRMDRIRLAASSGASLTVNSLSLRLSSE